MAVLQMQKISICALKSDRKALLEKLQALGMVEIEQDESSDDDIFTKMDTRKDVAAFEKNIRLVDNALDVLDIYAPKKEGFLSGLEGKKLISKEDFNKNIYDADEILSQGDRLISISKDISDKQAQIIKMEDKIEALAPWIMLDVPMNSKGTGKTSLLLGTVPATLSKEELTASIMESTDDEIMTGIEVISQDRDFLYISVICFADDREAVENSLRLNRFTRLQDTDSITPRDKAENLKKGIEDINSSIDVMVKEISDKSIIRENLEAVGDYYRMRKIKYEVIGGISQSSNAFIVTGYVPSKYSETVKAVMKKDFDCGIFIYEVTESDNPPTVLSNNKFSESMEGVVASYGLPHRGEFDPTAIMSFFYVFFFGLMLSDAAYGAIIAISCFLALKKFPRMGSGMRKNIKMFMFCGFATIFWGVMFGGYFGDVIRVVARTFFNTQVNVPALWFEPLSDPMKLLLWCMGFGLVHLFVGLGIKGYQEIKEGAYVDFFCDVVLWYVFLTGLIMMLLPTDIFASISQMHIEFSPGMNMLAKALSIIGMVGLLLMSGRKQKNPVLRLALGAYDIYNITGWLSDVLSYSRLLALGLATGVIASVVNQMGSMMGGGIINAILFTIVFIVGHLMNMAINILGAYVHTNRLQFVEFFGKFYEGGGRPFKPFINDTEYIDVKEDF